MAKATITLQDTPDGGFDLKVSFDGLPKDPKPDDDVPTSVALAVYLVEKVKEVAATDYVPAGASIQ